MDSKGHWEAAHRRAAPAEQSWYQPTAATSLALIRSVAPTSAAILDVGGGASTLVDGLLDAGYANVTVLDLSPTALEQARDRLGARATRVRWVDADVLTTALPPASVDLWHDRAVFHFLVAERDREAYVGQLRRALRRGGHVLIATFAEDGPSRCSGLPVARYSAGALQAVLGAGFRLLQSRRERHRTPAGVEQWFVYCLFRWEPRATAEPAG